MPISVDNGPGRGGRKTPNADLNLVPYIDLLTCMIAFLLITAVWTQLASMSVKEKGAGHDREALSDPPPKLIVLLRADGLSLVSGDETHAFPDEGAANGHDFARLGEALTKVKNVHPDRTDIEVSPEDAVHYETIVEAMDLARTAGFPDI